MTTLVAQVIELLAMLVIVAGPVPLALRLACADPSRPAVHRWLVALVGWSVVQIAVALVLGVAGYLGVGPVLFFECALLATGSFAAAGGGSVGFIRRFRSQCRNVSWPA